MRKQSYFEGIFRKADMGKAQVKFSHFFAGVNSTCVWLRFNSYIITGCHAVKVDDVAESLNLILSVIDTIRKPYHGVDIALKRKRIASVIIDADILLISHTVIMRHIKV